MGIPKLLLLSVLFSAFLFTGCVQQPPGPIACTEEARICADGTAVGRVPPSCEFAPCPSFVPTATPEPTDDDMPPLPPDDMPPAPYNTATPTLDDDMPPLPE
ncbi:MAG: hypothetical protein V1787_03665 [Candidatus Micrarchaeota archaeon]